jgi:hypothetical protein
MFVNDWNMSRSQIRHIALHLTICQLVASRSCPCQYYVTADKSIEEKSKNGNAPCVKKKTNPHSKISACAYPRAKTPITVPLRG